MSYKEMNFKGKRVFVEVDAAGELVLDKGRAVMRYKADDDRTYNPWPTNLTEPGAPIPKSSPTKRKKKEPAAPVPPVPDDGETIIAYTDGACSGNPGPSGLGYSITFPDGVRIARGEPLGEGTNNIAELTAIKRVLELVEDRNAPLRIHTDSSYSIGVLTQGWKAKANQSLIMGIRELLSGFSRVQFVKVKGHAGVPENELVDDLAREASETQVTIETAGG